MANETNLLHRVSRASGSLSPALQRVADVILASPEQTQASSLSELAARAGVADSTVSRFIRELGLDGFNQLRLGIAQAIYSRGPEFDDLGPQHVYEGVLRHDPVDQVLGKEELQPSDKGTVARLAWKREGEVLIPEFLKVNCE